MFVSGWAGLRSKQSFSDKIILFAQIVKIVKLVFLTPRYSVIIRVIFAFGILMFLFIYWIIVLFRIIMVFKVKRRKILKFFNTIFHISADCLHKSGPRSSFQKEPDGYFHPEPRDHLLQLLLNPHQYR